MHPCAENEQANAPSCAENKHNKRTLLGAVVVGRISKQKRPCGLRTETLSVGFCPSEPKERKERKENKIKG